MRREIIRTTEAPQPAGAYNQAVLAQGSSLLFIAGQLPYDPVTNLIVGEGDIRAQTERVLDNLAAILRAGGMTFDNLVRVGIFLTDLAHFEVVNEIYGQRFSAPPPARTTLNVARFRKNVLIEIDGIAIRGAGRAHKAKRRPRPADRPRTRRVQAGIRDPGS